MRFLGDRRGQSVWIGALLLLMVALLAFTIYQSTVVPQQTERVEFQHARSVQTDLTSLGARIDLLGATGGSQSVTVDLAPAYPTRLFALNPPEPAGTLRTRDRGPVRLAVGDDPVNLSRTCGYGGEPVTTASLAYEIDYGSYDREPTMAYDQSLQYRHTSAGYHLFGGGQSLVVDDSITLVPLAGDYSEADTGTAAVRLVGGPVNTTTVTAPSDEQVRLSLPSALAASVWEGALSEQSTVTSVEQTSENRVTVLLQPGQEYSLTCYAVGVGEAPPSGQRALGSGVGGAGAGGATTDTPATETATATETETATPVGVPTPTIENVDIQQNERGRHTENQVTVDWAASDGGDDIADVTVEVTDLNTSTTKTETYSVSGSSAEGSFSATFGKTSKPQGDTYRVVVIVEDAAGNVEEVRETYSV